MSKLKCQMKSKSVNAKVYPTHLPARAIANGGAHNNAGFVRFAFQVPALAKRENVLENGKKV